MSQSVILSATVAALEKLTGEHRVLTENHTTLTANHHDAVTENRTLRAQKEVATKRQSDTDGELSIARATVASLIKEKTGLQWDLANSNNTHDQLLIKYNLEVKQHLVANETHAKYKERTDEIISDREAEIQRLLDELVFLRKDNRGFIENKFVLENTISEIEGRLAQTIKEFRKETETREMLEMQLNDNRLSHQNEKRMRAELERVAVKLKYIESFRESNHIEYWKTRDRKLMQVTLGLANESKRLNNLVDLLPSDEKGGYGNETEFKWPDNVPRK